MRETLRFYSDSDKRRNGRNVIGCRSHRNVHVMHHLQVILRSCVEVTTDRATVQAPWTPEYSKLGCYEVFYWMKIARLSLDPGSLNAALTQDATYTQGDIALTRYRYDHRPHAAIILEVTSAMSRMRRA